MLTADATRPRSFAGGTRRSHRSSGGRSWFPRCVASRMLSDGLSSSERAGLVFGVCGVCRQGSENAEGGRRTSIDRHMTIYAATATGAAVSGNNAVVRRRST